jgi:hypothetical protein
MLVNERRQMRAYTGVDAGGDKISIKSNTLNLVPIAPCEAGTDQVPSAKKTT